MRRARVKRGQTLNALSMATVNTNAILLVHWSNNVSGVLFIISCTSAIGILQCFSFVATVNTNVILLVHWSNNVSGNEIGVIYHLSYEWNWHSSVFLICGNS